MPIADSILEKYSSAKNLSDEYLRFGDGGTAGSASTPALNSLSEAKYDLASSSDPMAATLIAELDKKENEVQDKIAEDNAYNPPPQKPDNESNKNIMPKAGTPVVNPTTDVNASSNKASKELVGPKPTPKSPSIRVSSGSELNGKVVTSEDDWRIRISVGQNSGLFYLGTDPGLMKILKDTAGVIFPYTPAITVSYSTNYSAQKNTHSNYPAYSYDNSEVQAIQIAGDFTVQNQDEGEYLLAALYFFRSAGKMFYGGGQLAGNPPPVLFLNGYGSQYFPNVPCVLTSFSHTMPGDVDYMEIESNSTMTRLPTNSQITIALQPVYSRTSIAEFDLEKFSSGKLLEGKRGFI